MDNIWTKRESIESNDCLLLGHQLSSGRPPRCRGLAGRPISEVEVASASFQFAAQQRRLPVDWRVGFERHLQLRASPACGDGGPRTEKPVPVSHAEQSIVLHSRPHRYMCYAARTAIMGVLSASGCVKEISRERSAAGSAFILPKQRAALSEVPILSSCRPGAIYDCPTPAKERSFPRNRWESSEIR